METEPPKQAADSVAASKQKAAPTSTAQEVQAQETEPLAVARPPFGDRLATFVDDHWVWEIIGVLGSALCIAGVCGFLYPFNGQPVPKWAFKLPQQVTNALDVKQRSGASVSLNSIIGWLTTIGKILVLIPVTKGLGQLKWVWFSESERVLTDFETFESATRGLSGSASLVWRFRGRHFAVLGALTVILSLAFDPLTQNLVSYPSTFLSYDFYSTQGRAWVSHTSNFSLYDDPADIASGAIDDLTRSTVMSAIYDSNIGLDGASSWTQPLMRCDNSNCTFAADPNIGVRALCANVTSQLVRNCTYDPTQDPNPSNPGCDVGLPNGFRLGGAANSRKITAAMNTTQRTGLRPLIYGNYSAPISIIQFIKVEYYDAGFTNLNSTTKLYAGECALLPAVITYTSSMNYANSLGSVDAAQVVWQDSYDSYYDDADLTSNGTVALHPPLDPSLNINSSTSSYCITPTAFKALQDFVNWMVPGHGEALGGTQVAWTSSFGNADFARALLDFRSTCYQTPVVQWSEVTACALQTVGKAMSISMRSAAVYSWYLFQDIDSAFDPVTPGFAAGGLLYRQVTVVRVTWYWIVFPVVLWVMSTVFIVGVVRRTQRSGARRWRTNPLAVVFLGLGEHEREEVKCHTLTESGLSKRAEHLRVQLHLDEREAKLVRRSGLTHEVETE